MFFSRYRGHVIVFSSHSLPFILQVNLLKFSGVPSLCLPLPPQSRSLHSHLRSFNVSFSEATSIGDFFRPAINLAVQL